MTRCAVPFCRNSFDKGSGVKFHKFPQNKHWKNVWYRKIKILKPLTHTSTICSKHFTGDDYFLSKSGKSMVLKQTAVPSLNIPANRLVFDCEKREIEEKRRQRENRIRNREAKAAKSFEITSTNALADHIIPEVYLDENSYADEVEIEPISQVRSVQVNLSIEHYSCDSATQTETCYSSKTKQSVHVEILKEDDFNYYTGFSFTQFEILYNSLQNERIDDSFDKYLNKKNQLFLCIMRYKLNLDFILISHLFGINRRIVSEIFKYWTSVLYAYFKTINFWDLRYENSNSYTAIIDCTEFETQRSTSNPDANQRIFSHYKNKPTFKVLLAIDEKGFVIFCSDVFGGSASDHHIVQESGFYDLLHAGDVILADRGFNIGDILAKKGVGLYIPPFKGRRNQRTEQEVTDRRLIANRRIYVERVIKMAKINKILAQTLPTFLWPIVNEIIYVGAFLSNFKNSVVQ